MSRPSEAYWNFSDTEILQHLHSTPQGLTSEEARNRLDRYGPNLLRPKKGLSEATLFLTQFKSPIILILILAAGLSLFLHDAPDAAIILSIVLISGLLGFWQERGATSAVAKLLALVQIRSTVLRDGEPTELPLEQIVPGDVILLRAGDNIPADCLILESKDLFVDEASLTGETYPVEKMAGPLPAEVPPGQRANGLFLGTHVVSGSGKALVIVTGGTTEFGKISERLKLKSPETEFERGVRRFGYLLMEVTLLLVIAIFAINVYFKRPILDSFLFALALAVGLTPQLLPAIITVNLSHGAKRMALQRVIVKRLASIENFGSMNVLCSDKTGTLTEGVIRLDAALDMNGRASDKVLLYAVLNARFETGFPNPIDEAIRKLQAGDLSAYEKLDEVPYDFIRKRLSLLLSTGAGNLMVTKGALPQVLSACSSVQIDPERIADIEPMRNPIQARFEAVSAEGRRTLGIAYKEMGATSRITKDAETGMTFLGFLIFSDPLKPGVVETIRDFRDLGISFKIITGDNRWVAAHVGQCIGLIHPQPLTGADLRDMSDEALMRQVGSADIFAEVEPNQKERIIHALRKAGYIPGYLGDGINDATALHAADVGISVDSAVDVAKEAADIVLLEKDLGALVDGVREGRKTFANTLKYVFMATSANFGNMFSMAGASLFLPFLPMLPKQILLTNLLTDLPEMTIATDHVDAPMLEKPRRWDIRFIRNFMLTFGPISSLFDLLTFAILLWVLRATPDQFRTGWFLESVISASVIVLVIRTRRPFFKSRPGTYLLMATLFIAAATLVLPFTWVGEKFGFTPLPLRLFLFVGVVVALYVAAAEVAKRLFYRIVRF